MKVLGQGVLGLMRIEPPFQSTHLFSTAHPFEHVRLHADFGSWRQSMTSQQACIQNCHSSVCQGDADAQPGAKACPPGGPAPAHPWRRVVNAFTFAPSAS